MREDITPGVSTPGGDHAAPGVEAAFDAAGEVGVEGRGVAPSARCIGDSWRKACC